VLGSWPKPAGGSLHSLVLPSKSQDMSEITVEQTGQTNVRNYRGKDSVVVGLPIILLREICVI
jgi:predicted house-cleaning NTP pyrophosphatase (Maf/HAM1 superfamily)